MYFQTHFEPKKSYSYEGKGLFIKGNKASLKHRNWLWVYFSPALVISYIKQLENTIKTEYPDTMIVYTLKNYTKSRHLKTLMI